MLHAITQDTAWHTDRTKIGLSLLSNEGEEVNQILTSHSAQNLIEVTLMVDSTIKLGRLLR